MSNIVLDPGKVMDAAPTLEQQVLVEQLAEVRGKLEGLASELRAVNSELEGLATPRRQHRLLLDVCGALTELKELGGADLFWNNSALGSASADQLQAHLQGVRARVDAFNKRIEEIEHRRRGIVARISEQQGQVDLLEDGLFEALEEEERRQQEWIVEREISALPARQSSLAWARNGEEDRRFRKNATTALVIALLVFLIFPMIKLPERVRDAAVEVPKHVVQLLTQSRPKPAQPKDSKPKVQKEEQVAKEEVKTRPNTTKPKEAEQEEVVDQGILAFKEKFASLQDDQVVARLGSQASINDAGAAAGRPQRSMLTTSGPGSSGGINLASLSRNVGGNGGNGMGKVQVARATSSIGGIGRPGQDRPLSGEKASMSRTDEEIQIVFDRYKAALYRMYNRELRKDPTLRGQMVLKLTIEADGSVSMCALQASDMNAPELSAQVVDRVRTINFGAKDGIPAITILYPIDFLPAA
jgi:hypothetical protein